MAVNTNFINKPLNPRGNDQSPKGYNRAALYSGKALDFDGVNDYVDLDGFTMSGNTGTFCFYADIDNDAYIFDVNPNRFIFLHNSAQGIRVFNTNGWSDYGLIDRENTLFYTIVCDGTSQSVYVNGQKFGDTKTITALDLSAATEFKLGSNYLGSGTFYNGTLSNYRIFNTALTAAQVADLYNNPEKVVPTGVDNTALKLWLPMQEGAGTTAYDGSGNGNHGTISGATYVNGVGAPVSQTAVIDWNKGTNYQVYSEDFSNADWQIFDCSVTANNTTAPDGQTTADKVAFNASASARVTDTYTTSTSNNKTHTVSVWAKVASGTEKFRLKCTHQAVADYFSSDLTATTEWQRFTFSPTFGASAGSGIITAVQNATDGAARNIFFWGFQLETNTSSVGPYIPTFATAQTSPVLLPQGLTSGRDITGVNLFENVRKQGALNLDGNSWAEVHDNASLDITDAITLEAWVQNSEEDNKGILGRWFSGTACYMLYKPAADNTFNFYINSNYVSSGAVTARDWHHVVGVYDGATKKVYVNGVLANSLSETATINTSSDPIEIGRFYGGPDTRTLAKQLAQPRIYNRALTAEEVQRNYNAGKNTYTN